MTDYYDRRGLPLVGPEAWSLLFNDPGYKRIGDDRIGEARVSTVWLGIDHGFGVGPPLIFETMIFGGPYNDDQWRYSTEAEAKAGHRRIVDALRRGVEP